MALGEKGEKGISSVSVGFHEKGMKSKQIEEVKKRFDDYNMLNNVIMSISYLGKFTEAEFYDDTEAAQP